MSGEIKLKGIQIKSLKKARILCKALSKIEEECGIKEVLITFEDTFVCPWIDESKLNKTEMEKLVASLITKF